MVQPCSMRDLVRASQASGLLWVNMMVMMPLLTVYSNLLGILGGGIVGETQLDVSFRAYMANAVQFAETKDLYVGLFKALLFGIIVTAVSCHQGFMATEGAIGVGRATRRAVIVSFLLILSIGYMTTRLFYL